MEDKCIASLPVLDVGISASLRKGLFLYTVKKLYAV
jgi:hypothetical protein